MLVHPVFGLNGVGPRGYPVIDSKTELQYIAHHNDLDPKKPVERARVKLMTQA